MPQKKAGKDPETELCARKSLSRLVDSETDEGITPWIGLLLAPKLSRFVINPRDEGSVPVNLLLWRYINIMLLNTQSGIWPVSLLLSNSTLTSSDKKHREAGTVDDSLLPYTDKRVNFAKPDIDEGIELFNRLKLNPSSTRFDSWSMDVGIAPVK